MAVRCILHGTLGKSYNKRKKKVNTNIFHCYGLGWISGKIFRKLGNFFVTVKSLYRNSIFTIFGSCFCFEFTNAIQIRKLFVEISTKKKLETVVFTKIASTRRVHRDYSKRLFMPGNQFSCSLSHQ